MNRRSFLGRLAIGAAAVLGAGAVKAGTAEAAGSEKALAVPATKDIVLKDRAKITGATISTTGRVVIDGSDIVVSNCTITSGGVMLTPNAQRVMLTGNLIQPWPEPFTGTLGPGTYVAPNSVLERGVSIRGAGIDKTTIVVGDTPIMVNGGVSGVHVEHLTVEPPTFEAMAADCAARGCRLSWDMIDDGPTIPVHRTFGDWITINSYAAGPLHDEAIDAWRRSLHEQSAGVPLVPGPYFAESGIYTRSLHESGG